MHAGDCDCRGEPGDVFGKKLIVTSSNTKKTLFFGVCVCVCLQSCGVSGPCPRVLFPTPDTVGSGPRSVLTQICQARTCIPSRRQMLWAPPAWAPPALVPVPRPSDASAEHLEGFVGSIWTMFVRGAAQNAHCPNTRNVEASPNASPQQVGVWTLGALIPGLSSGWLCLRLGCCSTSAQWQSRR